YVQATQKAVPNITHPQDVAIEAQIILAASEAGALTEQQTRSLLRHLSNHAAAGNQNGQLPFLLYHDVSMLEFYNDVAHQDIILERTINTMSARPRRPLGEMRVLMDFASAPGVKQHQKRMIEQALPRLT